MMNRKVLLLIMLLGLSPAAFAYDTEYVVMGGFSTIVNAFTRLKFIFNDNQYAMLVSAFVFMGMASAILFKGAKNGIEYMETGKAQMGMGWLALSVIGTMFYFGLVQPKGTVHIYDQSRNEYQAVSGIPDFITVTAGLTNSVYQAFVDMSNRDTASTTRFTGEGTAIKMMLNLVSRNGVPFDPYLTNSVKAFWLQCEPIAETRGFDPQSVKSGSNALDIVNALSPLRNQAAYTVWYTSSTPSGSTMTCDQAYTTLKSTLGSATAYDGRLKDICSKSGYTASNSAQYVDCKGRMESGLQTIFGASSLSLSSIMGNVLVSQAIMDALVQNNPEVAATMIANRSMMNSGIADATTNPEWMSTIMAGVLAIILAVTPMLLLLVFTPLMTKALTLLFGLWVFITTWQIADVLLLQASTDEILTVMSEIKTLGLGIDSMQLTPSAAMKAMSVMGSARSSAVQIATIVAGLFGVSAFGLSAFGQRALSKLDRTSDEVGDKTLTTEGRGHAINDTRSGLAASDTLSTVGIDKMVSSSVMGDLTSIHGSNASIQGLGGNINGAAMRIGDVHGGQQVGQVRGFENALPGISAGETAAMSSRVSAQQEVGTNVGRVESADAAGMEVTDAARLTSATSGAMQTADAKSNLHNANESLQSLHTQQTRVHGTERQTEIGTSEGTQQSADAAGVSIAQSASKRTSVNNSRDLGHSEGTLEAAGGSLSNVQSREGKVASVASAEGQGHANAMHNAYGDNNGIESGITATQTESTKQHAVDMNRQKDLVETIQNSVPGMPESVARRNLSDANGAQTEAVLTANNMDGRGVVENATYDATKHLAHNQGEQSALGDNKQTVAPFFMREGEISGQRTIAQQGKFDELSEPLGGDQKVAQAEAGATTQLVVSGDQAHSLQNSNMIDGKQASAVPADGVAKVDLAIGRNNNGDIATSGAVHSGHNASVDNSSREDSSLQINKGVDTGNGTSGMNVLTNPIDVHKLITASETQRPGSAADALANETVHSLDGLFSARNDKSDATNVSGGLSGGGGLKGMGSLGVNVGADASTSNTDTESTNAFRGSVKTQVEKIQAEGAREAAKLNLKGDAKQEYVNDFTARQFPQYYGDLVKHANAGTMEAGLETTTNKFNNDWNREHGINTRATVPEIPTNSDGSTKLISPQEYMESQKHKPAIETASENLTRTVAEEKLAASTTNGQLPTNNPNATNDKQVITQVSNTLPVTSGIEPSLRTEAEPHNAVSNGQHVAPTTSIQPETHNIDPSRRAEAERSPYLPERETPSTEAYKPPQSEAFVRPEIHTVIRNRKPDDEVKNETSGMDDTGMHPPMRGEGSSNKIPIAGDSGQTNIKTPK